jgi:p-hydroxybenzoate 3-monooxygenase
VRRQVSIVGGGPTGQLSHLLHLKGIESVVLERRSREDLETMVRAGEIDYVTSSRAAAMNIAENYVGAALGR